MIKVAVVAPAEPAKRFLPAGKGYYGYRLHR